jgi:hypothetical protein
MLMHFTLRRAEPALWSPAMPLVLYIRSIGPAIAWLTRRTVMRKYATLVLPLSALALLAAAAVARAELVVVDGQVQLLQPSVEVPARGSNMQAVEARFGAPASKSAAVGVPPITRWDYAGFSVYFENSIVIHAVAHAS